MLKIIPSGPYQTNAYVLSCPETSIAAIIDPSPDSAPTILRYLEQNHLKAESILLTHSHWDHIADVAPLKKAKALTVWIHPWDQPNLEHPGADSLPFPGVIEGVKPDKFFNDGDVIQVGNIQLRVIHTPGHSPGSVCFYDEVNGMLISGDTVFCGCIGNLSFPTSRPDLMESSLAKLAELPADTVVYPGHGPKTTIANEMANWNS